MITLVDINIERDKLWDEVEQVMAALEQVLGQDIGHGSNLRFHQVWGAVYTSQGVC